MSSVVSDEYLMAYVDGELSPEDARALELMIAQDPELEARLIPFATTSRDLGNLYSEIANQRVPDRLVHAVRARKVYRADATAMPSTSIITDWFGKINPFAANDVSTPNWNLNFSSAFGAVALILAGTFIGWGSAQISGEASDDTSRLFVIADNGSFTAAGELATVLETKPAVSTTDTESTGIHPVATFKSNVADGAICREYRITKPDAYQYAGIGCRHTATATWQIINHTRGKKPKTLEDRQIARDTGRPDVPNNTYQTADGGFLGIDAMVDQIRDGDMIAGSDEERLMAGGWDLSSK